MKRTPDNPVESVNPVMDKKEEGTTNTTTKKTTAKKTTTRKASTTKKVTTEQKAPAKRGRPAKKAPDATKAMTEQKAPVQQPENQQIERMEDDRLDRILKLSQNNSELIDSVNRKVSRVEERMIYMEQKTDKQEDKREEKKPSRFNSENIKKWLQSDSKLPVWGLIILALLIIFLTVWLDATVHHGPATERIGTTNVVYISNKNNDVTTDEPVKIAPDGVSVGEDIVIEYSDKK
ncbi:MAG: hypothetical protein IKI57_02145 [Clostridia bacterium]|nr:hypothetical protein [Clostridia bacterium]